MTRLLFAPRLIALTLLLAGCGSVQRVAECTLAESQPAMEPLATAIWRDAVSGRHAPTEVLEQDVRAMVVEYGKRLVMCALEELIHEWKETPAVARASGRSVAYHSAVGIAEQLRDSLR